MVKNGGSKNRPRRNQADDEDGAVVPVVVPLRSQPSDIDLKRTSKLELAGVRGSTEESSTPSRRRQAKGGGPTLELASGSAETNSTPSGRRRAKGGGPRLELASGSAEGNSTPSGIRQAEGRGPRVLNETGSRLPGAVRLYGRYGATNPPQEDDDADITVTGQDLDSNTIVSTPLLEAKLAVDIHAVIEDAFQKQVDAATAKALQNQASTLKQQQQDDAREEMENGRRGIETIAGAKLIVEQPKVCGVLPRRYAVYGFLVILAVVIAATLGVVLSDHKEPKNEPTISSVTTPAPVSGTLPDATTSAPGAPPTKAPPAETHFAVRTQLDPSMCLDVQSPSAGNLTPLQVLPCNGSPAQMFNLQSTGELKSAVGNGEACVEGDPLPQFQDAPVFLYAPCVDTWTVNADGEVVNDGEQLCLAVDGSAVSIQPCDGGGDQKWSLDQLQR
jgi:hypothetical protein